MRRISSHCLLLALTALLLLTAACSSAGSGPAASSAEPASASVPPAPAAPANPAVPKPEGDHPLPVEPEDAEMTDREFHCTISISCATILDNMELCAKEKLDLVPGDGWLLPEEEVVFYEGESVFNVLQRTCRQHKLHMEFMNTPVYNSAFIEGIGNLYEFDVGELSGWMYSVNDWFPNYGSSRYQLQDGDAVRFVYTCDLGSDVGGSYDDQLDE